MIEATVFGADALAARLDAVPQALATNLAQTAERLAGELSRRVRGNLSGAVLQQRSGRLAASVAVTVQPAGSGVTATVGSDAVYAAIHEYGGTLPARTIVPRNARALAFPWQGGERFFKHVAVPPVQMPERSFLRSALAAMTPEIRTALAEAAFAAAAGKSAPP